jgi:5'-methylthioadenosine phosphorylase
VRARARRPRAARAEEAHAVALWAPGVSWIIAISAVGSLKEEIHPGHIVRSRPLPASPHLSPRPAAQVIVDQLIDKTFKRASTFFEEGVVAHVPFRDPYCNVRRAGGAAPASRSKGASPQRNAARA